MCWLIVCELCCPSNSLVGFVKPLREESAIDADNEIKGLG
jgi:hypothetical protein